MEFRFSFRMSKKTVDLIRMFRFCVREHKKGINKMKVE
jgi:hypothetical protein